ncbi:hypothetical protein IC582_001672 [Cucumis melo]
MIGSLLYLKASRPNIAYAVGICAQFQSDPQVSHLAAVKRIIKYVHETSEFGIGIDAQMIKKITLGRCFFLGNNLIPWFSKKQNCVSLCIVEAEYIAVGSGCTQLIWMKIMLQEYCIHRGIMTLYCDNMSAIDISKNLVLYCRTKHIDIRHHFIMELIKEKIISLEHIRSNLQLTDIFTKPLDTSFFEHLRAGLGVCKF